MFLAQLFGDWRKKRQSKSKAEKFELPVTRGRFLLAMLVRAREQF
jgi:hypothetical protein